MMMMLRIALRSHWKGLIAIAALGSFLSLANTAGYLKLVGTTEEELRVFGAKMAVLAQQVVYMMPLPVDPETVGGYLQWRGYGGLGLIFAFWAVLAAAGAARGEEERGLVEQWLAAGVPRTRLVFARFAAFAGVAAAAVTLIGAVAYAGAAGYGKPLDAVGLVGKSLALFAFGLACYAIAFAFAQLAGSPSDATGAGGAAVFALFLLDGVGRTAPGLGIASDLSVFGLYHRTTSLAPTGRFDGPATAALFAIALVAALLAAAAFARRDLGAPLFASLARSAAPRVVIANPLFGLPVLGRLWEQRLSLLVWAGALVLIASFMLSLVDATTDLMLTTMRVFLRDLPGDPRLVLSATLLFGISLMLLAVFAVVQVAGWAEEDASGRLEMTLAQPVARWRVVAERAAALGVAVALLGAAASGAFAVGAWMKAIPLEGGRLAAAAALLVPFALTFGAVGAVLAAYRPRLAVFALATVAVLSFLVQFLGPPLGLPRWVLDLSVFELYGTPLVTEVSRGGLAGMLAIVAGGFGVALLLMQRREVGR
jgi:ABC-2 type transport system permease protein